MYKSKFYCEKNTKNFIGVGDPYIKKKTVSSRAKDKQFQTNPPKEGQTGAFTKFPEHKADGYTDKYKRTEKKFKVPGFGSNMNPCGDEFTSDVVSKQWREKLKGETRHLTTDELGGDEMLDPELATASFRKGYRSEGWFQTQVPFDSYDIGREGPNGTTPICNKCTRETFYCRHRIKNECPADAVELRRAQNGGPSPTSYNTYGSWTSNTEPEEKEYYMPNKPKAGRVRTTMGFFDKSHLQPGWAKN